MVINALQTAILVMVALIIHEGAHILTANYLGAKVEKVRFMPLGFFAKINGLEKLRAWERYVIYSAGALANGIAATWAYAVSRLSYVGVNWLDELAFYSLMLCIFNLLPILPLDGGRIAQQFLSNRIGINRANRIMQKVGKAAGVILIMLGMVQIVFYYYNITLLCAGVYIIRKNKNMTAELQLEFYRALEGKTTQERARQMPVKTICMPPSASIKKALDRLTLDHFAEFQYADKAPAISEAALLAYVFENGMHGTLEQVFLPQTPTYPNSTKSAITP